MAKARNEVVYIHIYMCVCVFVCVCGCVCGVCVLWCVCVCVCVCVWVCVWCVCVWVCGVCVCVCVRIPCQKNPSTIFLCTPRRTASALSNHLCLGLLCSPYHSGFPTITLHAFLFPPSPTRATCRANHIFLDFTVSNPTINHERYSKLISTNVTPITTKIPQTFFVLGEEIE